MTAPIRNIGQATEIADPLLDRLRKCHAKYARGKHPNSRANLNLGKDADRANIWRGPVNVPETGPQIVREFFAAINERKIPLRTVCRKAGISERSMQGWRSAHGVNLLNLIAAAQVLGYEVVLKRRGKA